jgi:hypothetical protein
MRALPLLVFQVDSEIVLFPFYPQWLLLTCTILLKAQASSTVFSAETKRKYPKAKIGDIRLKIL